MSWNSIRLLGFLKLLVLYYMVAASSVDSSQHQTYVDYILSNHTLACQADRLCSFNETDRLSEDCRSCVKCQCDDQCKLYGDCCPDLLFALPPHTDRKPQPYYCQSDVFKLLQPNEQKAYFFSVAKCSSFVDPLLVSLCHTPNWTDPYMSRPVTSSASGEVYRNEFCAQCNGETRYKPWSFRLACAVPLSVPSTMISIKIVKYFVDHPQCSVYFSPPNNTRVRKCYADSAVLIRTCNETGVWQNYDALMEKACEGYYSPVLDRSRSFKNIFCFYCNTKIQNKPNRNCELDVSEQFTVLLQSDRIQTSQRQTEHRCECYNDEVYHKFKKICRPLMCSYGRSLEGKQCVSSYTSTENAPYSLEMTLTPAEDIFTAPDRLNWMSSIASGITATFHDKTKGYDIRIHVLHLRSVMNVNETRVLRLILRLNLILVSGHQLDKFESLVIDIQNSKWLILVQRTFINMSSSFSSIFSGNDSDRNFKNETILVTSNETNYHYLTYTDRTEHLINRYATPISYTTVSRTLFCPLVELDRDETRFLLGNTFVMVETNLTVTLSDSLVAADGKILICQDIVQGTNLCSLQGIFSKEYILVSRICLGLSLVCLFATLVVFSLFPSLRTLPGKNIMGLISTLFVAITLNLFGIRLVKTTTLCKIIGIVFHLFLLSSFTWMGICTFHMYRVFTSVIKSRRSISTRKNVFPIYLFISIIVPLVIILVVMGINYAINGLPDVGYGTDGCYVSNFYSIIIGMLLPVSVIVVFNIVLFILTVVSLRKMSVEHQKLTGKKENVYMYVKLSSLTGFNWVFAFVAPLTGVQELWYVFAVLCGLQGVYIFLAFVFNRRVFKLFKNMFQGKGLLLSETTGHNLQTSSTRLKTMDTPKQIEQGNGVVTQDTSNERSTNL